MNVTASKDGIRRATMQIPFRIGEDELVYAAARVYDSGKFPSRANVLQSLRDILSTHGEEWHWEWERQPDLEQYRPRAEEQVRRLFPEFWT